LKGGVAARLLTMLVFGSVAGLLIYFSPRLFFGSSRPVLERPQLKTGGTSSIFVVAENLWKRKYAEEKKVDIVCDSAGTTVGVTWVGERNYVSPRDSVFCFCSAARARAIRRRRLCSVVPRCA